MDRGSYNFFILEEIETYLTIDNLKDFGSSKRRTFVFLMIEAAS